MDVNSPLKGMNQDTHPANLDGTKAYTFALNARQESEDGGEFNLTNEPTNTLAVNFPEGYKVIGRLNIVDIGRTIYWLVNPSNGYSEIGYVENDPLGCIDVLNTTNPPDTGAPVYGETSGLSTTPCLVYTTIVSDPCMNFDIAYPIHEAEYKITNRTVEIYWTDNHNPPRWMDINNPPIVAGSLDCNLLSIFPDHLVPEITVLEVQDTGSLKVGSYQFLVAYSNSVGAPLSQYYSVSDPCPIWENKESPTQSFDTSKAIKIRISNIDQEYKYINIAVIKTVNYTETFELATTLSIVNDYMDFTYSGNDKTLQPLTREEVYFRAPYYRTAGTITSQNRLLMLGNLVTEQRINYQPIASALNLFWQTYRIPYNKFEAYNNGANAANLRSYMRDEVYAFDMVVIEKSGRVSDRFHIPGRIAAASDLAVVVNEDAANTEQNPCDPIGTKRTWQVYNTATKRGFVGNAGDPCYIGPWEWGDMAYWESERKYPNNTVIWGSLAGQPIRHHRFPDSTITHIHDNNPGNDIGFEHSIFPIGVMFDKNNVLNAIANSPLTQEQKDNIAAIRILRSNRRTNKSIQAKGIIFNVGSYKFQDEDFLFANYPLNDTNPDVFLSTESKDPVTGQYTSAAAPYSGLAKQARLNAFTGADQSRYTFISPDTTFIHPSLSGQLKLETIEYGKSNSHVVHVQNNPRYEIGTQKGVKMAVVLALTTILSINFKMDFQVGSVSSVSTIPGIDISFAQFLPAFLQAYDMINKLIPFEQYGYQFNAVGNYCNAVPVPNNGNKIRMLTSVGYVGPDMETIPGETATLNNWQREPSVYCKTSSALPYPWSYTGIPRDNSRWNFGSYKDETGQEVPEGQRILRDTSVYYASIKKAVPDQYGDIHSYVALDTGYTLYLDKDFPTVFGGDTFINRFAIKRKLPFFISNTCGAEDNTDVDYSFLGNVAYPTYYMSTGPLDPRISNSTLALFNTAYNFLTSVIGVILAIVSGGLIPYGVVLVAMFALLGDIISNLGIKKVNLDRFHDSGFYLQGAFYLFCYGIPYFFVESDFNCDYRQASDGLEGNFFPRVGTDIPDYWLQEKNVSIATNEQFNYNRDLSKQNLADFYTYLPEDWNPKDNSYIHSTRVIYSEPYNIEEQQNNWLLFRANNFWDFTFNNGALTSLRAIEQDKVLTRFENNFAVYNALITVETSVKDLVVGSGSMFSNPPQEYSRTDIGYSGSQHKAFCSTPYGHFWVDAKRGCVFNLSGGGAKDIARNGMMNWFKENLPFKILRYFPDMNVDNNYNGIGIAMVWDNRFNRLFITKRDYIPLDKGIIYKDGRFYLTTTTTSTVTTTTVVPVPSSTVVSVPPVDINHIPYPAPYSAAMVARGIPSGECCPDGYAYNPDLLNCYNIENPKITEPAHPCSETEVITTTAEATDTRYTEVFLCDPKYFCPASWTIAWSPVSESWVSFYSFIPNWYTEQQQFFQSGIQECQEPTLWNHLLTNKSYQTFYNIFRTFEIETVTKPALQSGVLTAINYRMDILRYENAYDYRFMKDITFTQALISSPTQTSGYLDMHVQRKDNLNDGVFAVQNLTSISIPVSNLDNLWRFAKLSDVTKDANSLKPLFTYDCANVEKVVNNDAVDYGKPFHMGTIQRLKSDWFKVKLVNNVHARYKFVFKWLADKVTNLLR